MGWASTPSPTHSDAQAARASGKGDDDFSAVYATVAWNRWRKRGRFLWSLANAIHLWYCYVCICFILYSDNIYILYIIHAFYIYMYIKYTHTNNVYAYVTCVYIYIYTLHTNIYIYTHTHMYSINRDKPNVSSKSCAGSTSQGRSSWRFLFEIPMNSSPKNNSSFVSVNLSG